jgi:hypothetical protein
MRIQPDSGAKVLVQVALGLGLRFPCFASDLALCTSLALNFIIFHMRGGQLVVLFDAEIRRRCRKVGYRPSLRPLTRRSKTVVDGSR